MLHDCGVPVKHLVEPFAAHADYVISWKPRPTRGPYSKVGFKTDRLSETLDSWSHSLCCCASDLLFRPLAVLMV